MKKFFSAILLMTMMVFSVGTFVSCNDLVTEVEDVKGQMTELDKALEALENEVAALETALATAQKAADDAKAAANEAKAAAEQAKADAIAEAKAQVESLKTALETAIAGKADKAEVEQMAKDVQAALAIIDTKIAALAEKDAALEGQIAELLQADTEIKAQIEALENYGKDNSDSLVVELSALQNELDQIWQAIGSETGLQALVGTQAGLIEDLQAELQGFYEEVYSDGPNSIKSQLASVANCIEDLRAEMDAARKAVEQVNANLSIYSTIIGDLANRIQSITFVPEFIDYNDVYDVNGNYVGSSSIEPSKNIYARQYYIGESYNSKDAAKSPFMIRATYEISPKGLVNTLTDENLFFSTAELKASPAEYLQAKIVERDGTTGRMVVVGYIPEDSDTYKNLWKGEARGVAFALNITDQKIYNVEDKDGLQQTIDAGTHITSAYDAYALAGAYVTNVSNALYFQYVDEETEETVYSRSYNNLEEVPYKTSIEDSKRDLFQIDDVVMYFQGSYLTKDQVKNILGIDYTLTVPEAKVTYNAAQGKKSPVAVTGKDLTATAAFVASDDYKGAAAVGQQAVAVLNGFKVNEDIETGLYAQATYRVDYESADITLTKPATIPWAYNYGYAWFEWNNLANSEELDVTGTDDITVLKDKYGNVMSPNSYIEFEGEAIDSKGKKYYAWVNVCALSKKAVRFVSGSIPYAKGEELTYKFETVLYDNDAVEYTVAFEATTEPMPTDKTITLDTKVNGRLSSGMSAAVGLLNATLTEDAAFYPEAFSKNDQLNFFMTLMNNGILDAATTVQKYDATKAKYVDIDNNDKFMVVTTLDKKQDGTIYDASGVTIAEGAATFGDKFIFTKKVNLFGVEYTYVVNAEVVKPGYALSYNATYVDNGVVTLGGKVGLPSYSTSSGKFTSSAFALQAIDLRRYVIVENEVAGELMLQYNLKTRKLDAQQKPTIVPDITYATGPMTTDAYEANIVGWNDKSLNEVEFEISLVSKATTEKNGVDVPAVVYDTKKVVLQIPDFVTFDAPAANIEKVTYKSGEVNRGNIAQTLVIKDAETGKVNLKNPYATRLDQIFWGAMQVKVGNTKTNTVDENNRNGYAVYGQKVTAKADKVHAYLESSKEVVDPQDYKYYTEETVETIDGEPVTFYPGDVRLMIEDANITDNIIVVVPVELTHDYCGSKVHKTVEAKVKFTK